MADRMTEQDRVLRDFARTIRNSGSLNEENRNTQFDKKVKSNLDRKMEYRINRMKQETR
jgi:hypothetical protein